MGTLEETLRALRDDYLGDAERLEKLRNRHGGKLVGILLLALEALQGQQDRTTRLSEEVEAQNVVLSERVHTQDSTLLSVQETLQKLTTQTQLHDSSIRQQATDAQDFRRQTSERLSALEESATAASSKISILEQQCQGQRRALDALRKVTEEAALSESALAELATRDDVREVRALLHEQFAPLEATRLISAQLETLHRETDDQLSLFRAEVRGCLSTGADEAAGRLEAMDERLLETLSREEVERRMQDLEIRSAASARALTALLNDRVEGLKQHLHRVEGETQALRACSATAASARDVASLRAELLTLASLDRLAELDLCTQNALAEQKVAVWGLNEKVSRCSGDLEKTQIRLDAKLSKSSHVLLEEKVQNVEDHGLEMENRFIPLHHQIERLTSRMVDQEEAGSKRADLARVQTLAERVRSVENSILEVKRAVEEGGPSPTSSTGDSTSGPVLALFQRMQGELEYIDRVLGEVRDIMDGVRGSGGASMDETHVLWQQLIGFRKLLLLTVSVVYIPFPSFPRSRGMSMRRRTLGRPSRTPSRRPRG
jgi:DNA repair exonuclease SbcCD ATPase subunit